jgi:hypothetical protein
MVAEHSFVADATFLLDDLETTFLELVPHPAARGGNTRI